jgi:hypothetical protein
MSAIDHPDYYPFDNAAELEDCLNRLSALGIVYPEYRDKLVRYITRQRMQVGALQRTVEALRLDITSEGRPGGSDED